MPVSNCTNGCVVVDGVSVTLTAAQVASVAAAKAAQAATLAARTAFRPMTVLTFSGRRYGGITDEMPIRYGIAWATVGGKAGWYFLDKWFQPIPGTSWKAKNLNRAKFTFNKP